MTPGPLILWSPWKRNGLSYEANIQYKNLNGYNGDVKIRYGFFTYHLIKWIHGNEFMYELISDRIEKLKIKTKSEIPF